MDGNPSKAELVAGFDGLYTGAITDVLDEMGHENQTLDPEIGPLSVEMYAVGIAFPLTGQPNDAVDYDESIRTVLEMLGDAGRNDVLLYDTGDTENAHIGELTTAYLAKNACAGAVVDGGARDTAFIREQDYPVFSRYETPKDCIPRWELQEWNVSVNVGGVAVDPGDVVVADSDGVVAVPRAIAGDVLERATETVKSEDAVRTAILNGAQPLDAYDAHVTF